MFHYSLIFCSLCSAIIFILPIPAASSSMPKCGSYQEFGYKCVPYYQCDEYGNIKRDGAGIVDPRENLKNLILPGVDHYEALNGVCDQLLNVCCRLGGERAGRAPNVTTPQCGKRNAGSIIENSQTSFGEWPHVCAIIRADDVRDDKLKIFWCAGSLVSRRVILTAAHCVNNFIEETLIVRCGEWDTSNDNEELKHQERKIQSVLIHPDYNKGKRKNLHNDFALLITETNFDLVKHINPVCLPSPKEDYEQKVCVVNGWGKNKIGSEGQFQKILKQINLPLVDHQECQEMLRKTRLGRFFRLDDSFICAGGEKGVDTCKGDGGGPLTCQHGKSGPWVQAGIVSWGIGCGAKGTPAVYARVSKAVCWMETALNCYFGFNNGESHLGFKEDCLDDYSVEKCEPFKEKPLATKSQATCGLFKDKELIDVRITDESTRTETYFGEWPHVCAVINSEDVEQEKVNIFKCAGSLVSTGVILTAAHCLDDESNDNLLVRCGEWNTFNEKEELEHQERAVKSVIFHPNFNRGNLQWDFALLIVETDFILADHINPVCLPSPNEIFEQRDCVANGWGKDKFGSDGQFQKILKQVKLPLIKHQECQEKLRKTRLGRFFWLNESFMCAGGERGVDTCKGDGGGPLTCHRGNSNQRVQAGIVSWGIGCGAEGTPAVYARVSKAVCWIDKVIGCNLGLDPGESMFGFEEDCLEENSDKKCE